MENVWGGGGWGQGQGGGSYELNSSTNVVVHSLCTKALGPLLFHTSSMLCMPNTCSDASQSLYMFKSLQKITAGRGWSALLHRFGRPQLAVHDAE